MVRQVKFEPIEAKNRYHCVQKHMILSPVLIELGEIIWGIMLRNSPSFSLRRVQAEPAQAAFGFETRNEYRVAGPLPVLRTRRLPQPFFQEPLGRSDRDIKRLDRQTNGERSPVAVKRVPACSRRVR